MSPSGSPLPRALTIAGSDPSGGAGLQADLRTFAALGVWGTSAVTAVTVQNTLGVLAAEPVAAAVVAAQIRAVLDDLGADAVKTGMLATGEIVRVVAQVLRTAGARNLVVDPVLASTGGVELLDAAGREHLVSELIPLARIVTPNAAEAAALSGVTVEGPEDAERAGRGILELGCGAVVVKGGHLRGEAVDVLVEPRGVRRFVGERLLGEGAHGTGCVFSAALAAHLALGAELEEAVALAKSRVTAALRQALRLGRGRSLLA
jgi:hydroxymethylpyrimidine kinase/phosphomethylpyrimidine kinase